MLSAEWDVPGVLTSALGAEAAVRGAAALALRRVFADPALVAELRALAEARAGRRRRSWSSASL